MNDKDLNAKTTEVRRVLPVMLKVENLHIHLDERSTSNTYFNGAEEEEPDIDIEAMIDAIATKTGLCKQAVMMVLDAESEYLDSVYGEDDEVDEDQQRCGKPILQHPDGDPPDHGAEEAESAYAHPDRGGRLPDDQ